jgi:hypothetical protein
VPARKSVQMKRCRSPTESGVVSLLYWHGPTSSPKGFHPLADRGVSLPCGDICRSSVAKVFGDGIRPAICISLRSPLLGNGVAGQTVAGPLDNAFTRNGRYMYVVTRSEIIGYQVEADGSLTPLNLTAAIPSGSRGLVAR